MGLILISAGGSFNLHHEFHTLLCVLHEFSNKMLWNSEYHPVIFFIGQNK